MSSFDCVPHSETNGMPVTAFCIDDRAKAARKLRQKQGILTYLRTQNTHHHATQTALERRYTHEVAVAEAELKLAREKVANWTRDRPGHLEPRAAAAAARAKLNILSALGSYYVEKGPAYDKVRFTIPNAPTKKIVRGHLTLLKLEEEALRSEVVSHEPAFRLYKMHLNRLGEALGVMRHLRCVALFGSDGEPLQSPITDDDDDEKPAISSHLRINDGSKDIEEHELDEDRQRQRRRAREIAAEDLKKKAAADFLKRMGRCPFNGIEIGGLQEWQWYCADKLPPDGHGCPVRSWLRRAPQQTRAALMEPGQATNIRRKKKKKETFLDSALRVAEIREKIRLFYEQLVDHQDRIQGLKVAGVWNLLEQYFELIESKGRKPSEVEKGRAAVKLCHFLRYVLIYAKPPPEPKADKPRTTAAGIVGETTSKGGAVAPEIGKSNADDENAEETKGCPMCQLFLRLLGLYRPIADTAMFLNVYLQYKPMDLYPPELVALESEPDSESVDQSNTPVTKVDKQSASTQADGSDSQGDGGLIFVLPDTARSIIAETGLSGPQIYSFESVVQYDNFLSEIFSWEPPDYSLRVSSAVTDVTKGSAHTKELLEMALAESNELKRLAVEADIQAEVSTSQSFCPTAHHVPTDLFWFLSVIP
eukprot:SAG31_NODE_48_length_30945_cov_16.254263_36_plen_648_part_00